MMATKKLIVAERWLGDKLISITDFDPDSEHDMSFLKFSKEEVLQHFMPDLKLVLTTYEAVSEETITPEQGVTQ